MKKTYRSARMGRQNVRDVDYTGAFKVVQAAQRYSEAFYREKASHPFLAIIANAWQGRHG